MALMWLAFSINSHQTLSKASRKCSCLLVHFYYIYQILAPFRFSKGLVPRPVQWVWFQNQCSGSGSKTSTVGLVPRPVQQVWFQDQCSGSGSKTSAVGLVPRLLQQVWFQDQCSWYKITNAAVDKGFLLRTFSKGSIILFSGEVVHMCIVF